MPTTCLSPDQQRRPSELRRRTHEQARGVGHGGQVQPVGAAGAVAHAVQEGVAHWLQVEVVSVRLAAG